MLETKCVSDNSKMLVTGTNIQMMPPSLDDQGRNSVKSIENVSPNLSYQHDDVTNITEAVIISDGLSLWRLVKYRRIIDTVLKFYWNKVRCI